MKSIENTIKNKQEYIEEKDEMCNCGGNESEVEEIHPIEALADIMSAIGEGILITSFFSRLFK